jgi:predicted dehydrogenase
MSQEKINKSICVVGGGRWGENHIRTLHVMGNLGGIVENDTKRLEELLNKYPSAKGYFCLEDAIKEGYDGYVVSTPAHTHFKIGSFLLEHKQNVLIEKPLALCSMDSENLLRLAKSSGSRLMVGHLLLFHSAIRKIKEVIEEGRLGKLEYVYSNRLNLGTVRTEENVFWSFAPHDISVFDFLIGKPPESINASGGCFLQGGIWDTVLAEFTYPDNIKAHIFVSWLHPFKEQRLVIIGSKGMLVFEDSSQDKEINFYDKRIEVTHGKPVKREGAIESIPYEMSSPLENELKFFIGHLESDITVADGQCGHETVKVLEKVTERLSME